MRMKQERKSEKRNRKWWCLALLFFFLAATPGYGEEAPKTNNEKTNTISLDEVIVRGEALYKDLEASSATVLTGGCIPI